jgi:hypothetical protein
VRRYYMDLTYTSNRLFSHTSCTSPVERYDDCTGRMGIMTYERNSGGISTEEQKIHSKISGS